MKRFFQWLLDLGIPKQQQEQEPEQGKKLNNVSVDGLSAEKNVLQSIRSKTGVTLGTIREFLFSEMYCWRCHYRPGDKQRYYDKETRAAMIDVCIKHFGKIG